MHARMEKTHTNKKPVNALLSPHQQAKNKSQNTRTQDAHMHPAHRADVRALAGDGGRRSLTDMLEGMPTVRSDADMGAGDLGGDGGAADAVAAAGRKACALIAIEQRERLISQLIDSYLYI